MCLKLISHRTYKTFEDRNHSFYDCSFDNGADRSLRTLAARACCAPFDIYYINLKESFNYRLYLFLKNYQLNRLIDSVCLVKKTLRG